MDTNAVRLGARHLYYLCEVGVGKFDRDLRAGRFASDNLLRRTVREMFESNLLTYNGVHHVTQHGKQICAGFSEKNNLQLPALAILTCIYIGDFDTRLKNGLIEDTARLSGAILDLMQNGFIEYDGAHNITSLGNARVVNFLDGLPQI